MFRAEAAPPLPRAGELAGGQRRDGDTDKTNAVLPGGEAVTHLRASPRPVRAVAAGAGVNAARAGTDRLRQRRWEPQAAARREHCAREATRAACVPQGPTLRAAATETPRPRRKQLFSWGRRSAFPRVTRERGPRTSSHARAPSSGRTRSHARARSRGPGVTRERRAEDDVT